MYGTQIRTKKLLLRVNVAGIIYLYDCVNCFYPIFRQTTKKQLKIVGPFLSLVITNTIFLHQLLWKYLSMKNDLRRLITEPIRRASDDKTRAVAVYPTSYHRNFSNVMHRIGDNPYVRDECSYKGTIRRINFYEEERARVQKNGKIERVRGPFFSPLSFR